MEKKNKMNLLVRILLVFVVSAAVLTAVVVASGLNGQDNIVTAGYTIEQTSPSDAIVTEQTTEATTSETTAETSANSDSQNGTKKTTKKTTNKTAKKTTKKTAAGTAAPTAAKTTAAPTTTQKTTTRQTVATTTTLSNAQRESLMFNNINSYRKNQGAGGLSRVTSGPLYNAARKRLSEICSSFSHTRPNGTDFSTVLAECGVSYSRAGENLGCGSLEGVYSGWISSSGHRKNIVNGAFHKSALVCTVSGGKRYWVQLFIN